MLKDNNVVNEQVEQCWYAAFLYDTRMVNYLRLVNESNNFQKWQEKVNLVINRMKTSVKDSRYVSEFELKMNYVDINQLYLIALFNGQFQYIKDEVMNNQKSLGWSYSFMKTGLMGYMLLLYQGNDLSSNVQNMLWKLCAKAEFNLDEYQEGILADIQVSKEVCFWRCLQQAKLFQPISIEIQEVYIKWLKELVAKRVEAIINSNHRNYYAECAHFVGALGEVLESRGLFDGKQKIMYGYKQAYPRRTAFHRELRAWGMIEPKDHSL